MMRTYRSTGPCRTLGAVPRHREELRARVRGLLARLARTEPVRAQLFCRRRAPHAARCVSVPGGRREVLVGLKLPLEGVGHRLPPRRWAVEELLGEARR